MLLHVEQRAAVIRRTAMTPTIPFTCPECKAPALARPGWIGKQVKCIKCGCLSRVPKTETPVPPMPGKPETDKIETVHDLPSVTSTSGRWEYRVVRHTSGSVLRFLDDMNALGDDGWECVGVLQPGVLLYKRSRTS